MGCGSERFGGNIKLNVASIAVEVEVISAEDVTKGEHIEDKEKWSKHRTLGDAMLEWGCGGGGVIDSNKLLSVHEI